MLVTKTDTFRFGEEINKRLSAWSLLLKKDKTSIMKDAFIQWEENQFEVDRTKISNILKELN